MPPKKTNNKRQSSTQGQFDQQNLYENLINQHQRYRKNKSKHSYKQQRSSEEKSKKQIQTKLPYKSHKQIKKIINKKNQQNEQIQTSLHFYEYVSKSQGQGPKHRLQILKDKKIRLLEKIMKIQAEKLKIKNQYHKIWKRLNKNWPAADENKGSLLSQEQLQGKYVIYYRDIQKCPQQSQSQKTFKDDKQLTDIILYANSSQIVINSKKNTNEWQLGQAQATSEN